MLVGRAIDNTESIKKALIDNGILRTFNIIDSEGMIDVDSLAKDLKREIEHKERLIITLPMFGKMTFTCDDVDSLYNYITVVNFK